MTVAGASTSKFDMGRAIRPIFPLIGRNGITFGLLAIVLVVVPQFAWLTWLRLAGHQFPTGLGAYGSGWFWANQLVDRVTDAALQAAIVYGGASSLRGQTPSLHDCFANMARLFPAVLAISLAANVAATLGLLLFVVPGVVMGLAWAVVVPAEVVERTGIRRAFDRSADLTRKHRWELLGIFVIYALVSAALVLVLRGVNALWSKADWAPWAGAAIAPFQNGVLESFFSIGLVSVYFELRLLKEGVGPDQLATVFD